MDAGEVGEERERGMGAVEPAGTHCMSMGASAHVMESEMMRVCCTLHCIRSKCQVGTCVAGWSVWDRSNVLACRLMHACIRERVSDCENL